MRMSTRKAIFSALAIFLFAALSGSTAFAAPTLQRYAGEIPPPIDVTLANTMPVTGYYEQTVDVDGSPRTVKVYLPDGIAIREYFTVVSIPDGVETTDFLDAAGWFDLADEKKEGLFVLEPVAGAWGDVTAELPYVTAALTQMSTRSFYAVFGCHYLVGYGGGAGPLEAWAANNPMHTISAVYVNGGGLSASYLAAAGAAILNPEVTGHASVSKSAVPVPTWIVRSADLEAVSDSYDYWSRSAADGFELITSYSDVTVKVQRSEMSSLDYTDSDFTRSLYDFNAYYTRYDNTSVFGNVLGVRPHYGKIGVDTRYISIVNDFDGARWNREYLAYVPKNSASLYPDGAPVLYIAHGQSQTDRVFFDATHWWEVADKYGFICVFLHGSYNTSIMPQWNLSPESTSSEAMNDLEYLKAVIADVDARYSTDPDRRFMTGQSMGCAFSHLAAYYMPEYFTAVGATSLVWALGDTSGFSNERLPMYLILGEFDINSYHLDDESDSLRPFAQYWLNRNGLAGVDDWTSLSTENRFTTYEWQNEDAIPWFRYGWTKWRSHNCIVDEMWVLWEDWFSKWDRDEEGNRVYAGTSSGGGSSGCNAGLGMLTLMLLTIVRKRK